MWLLKTEVHDCFIQLSVDEKNRRRLGYFWKQNELVAIYIVAAEVIVELVGNDPEVYKKTSVTKTKKLFKESERKFSIPKSSLSSWEGRKNLKKKRVTTRDYQLSPPVVRVGLFKKLRLSRNIDKLTSVICCTEIVKNEPRKNI